MKSDWLSWWHFQKLTSWHLTVNISCCCSTLLILNTFANKNEAFQLSNTYVLLELSFLLGPFATLTRLQSTSSSANFSLCPCYINTLFTIFINTRKDQIIILLNNRLVFITMRYLIWDNKFYIVNVNELVIYILQYCHFMVGVLSLYIGLPY